MIHDRKRLSAGLAVTLKVFVRSRNGSAMKVVREHYLRDDIPCYSQACTHCLDMVKTDSDGHTPNFTLLASPVSTKDGVKGHYLVVDTNIVLHAIDLLEGDHGFYDVIVPQTVLEEVKNRSFPIYHRLRALVKKETKRFVVFHNEYCEETYIARRKNESINDRNDRAIRKTAAWYGAHLADKIDVIFICNDRDNRQKAESEGIVSKLLIDYIELLLNADDLRDLVPTELAGQASTSDASFPDYYSNARIMAGLKNGTIYQGMLNISQHNVVQGQVSVAQFKKPLLVLGLANLNRSFHLDLVFVELLPQNQWKEFLYTIVDDKPGNEDVGDGDVSLPVVLDRERQLLAQTAIRDSGREKLQPTARVVGIQRRLWRYYVGQIDPTLVDAAGGLRECMVVLMDKQLPRLRISTRKASELVGQRIVVVVDSWPETLKHPLGHFVRALGPIELAAAETEALLLEHDVEYRPFLKNVLDCLPKEGDKWVVPDVLPEGRFDLRDKLVCLIDPPSCVDIDDALHAKSLPNGNFEVGVHIADVTHFVKPNTALDAEGALRATLVYLVDKRIDMLPMLLGTNLCSLKPYVERFAFLVIWELDSDANIINVKFMKLVIRSREAFSYERAQQRIDDKLDQLELTELIRVLLRLSQKLKQQRIDAGALNLASPEVKVYVDSETLDPNEVEIKQPYATNSLVEEFMLLANILVARKIYEAYPQTAMLRRHAAPPLTNFEELNDMLRARKPGMAVSLELLKALADSLDRCVDPNDPYFNTLLRIMLTRCMMAAEYFALGMYGRPDFRHYGLAVDIYTHFTSPIRRYCDVVAHRQLAGAIGYETLDLLQRDKGKMELMVKNMNRRHRNAQFAGRASIEYYVGQVMRDNHEEHEGYVIKCFSNGIVVLVPKFGVEGLIKLETIGDVTSAEFHEDDFQLEFTDFTGKRRKVGVFDKVNVDVKSIKDEVSGKRKAQLLLK